MSDIKFQIEQRLECIMAMVCIRSLLMLMMDKYFIKFFLFRFRPRLIQWLVNLWRKNDKFRDNTFQMFSLALSMEEFLSYVFASFSLCS
jgi:hypothetical protein